MGTGEVQPDNTDFVNMIEGHGVVSVRLAIRPETVTVTRKVHPVMIVLMSRSYQRLLSIIHTNSAESSRSNVFESESVGEAAHKGCHSRSFC